MALALSLFLAWAAGLLTMAVVVASPVTLNRAQIINAEVIVQGKLDPNQSGRFLVDRSWPTNSTDAVISIEELQAMPLEPRQSTLIPLRQAANGAYAVVLTPEPSKVPLVYPATDETIAALEAIIDPQHQ